MTATECAGQFDVSPGSRVVGWAAGTTSFSVDSGVGWSVEDDAAWLTATKTNGSTISVSFEANTSMSSRTAHIRAYGTGGVEETVTVTQRDASTIADFEGTLDPGWTVLGDATWEITPNWSSSGTSSLRIMPDSSGFFWCLQFEDTAVIQKLSSTHYLVFDVHWVADEWLPESGGDAFSLWDIGSLNSDVGGWAQLSDKSTQIFDPMNPGNPGSWDPVNWGGSGSNHQRTLIYDFTGLGYDATGASWAQLKLAINSGLVETLGSFYIDNIRLEQVSSEVELRVSNIEVMPVTGGMEVALQVQVVAGRMLAYGVSVEHSANLADPWNEIGEIGGDGTFYAGVVTAPEGGIGFIRVVGH